MTYRRLDDLGAAHLVMSGVVLAAASLVGCFEDSYDGYGRYDDSSIVFGIDQTKGADGKVTTSVGYEMLDVRSKGWSARGFVTADRSCWAERLDDRLGQPHVEGGFAKFQGGLLPPEGVAVVANRADDLTLPGPAWTNAGESLTFEAHGFAMPDIAPSPLVVPSLDLAIVSPAEASADVAIPAGQELEVDWTASDKSAPRENVVASLTAVPAGEAEARGVELRCFFDRTAGKGSFPKNLTDRFATLLGATPGTAVKGKLHIATHRQLTIFARGGWTVYVVATAAQREQPFTLQR
ncbi:MAG: hypothetical protein JWP87_3602 [Labilithrix sp.]|nr:hypothetical protein [Labilithrix sp.]